MRVTLSLLAAGAALVAAQDSSNSTSLPSLVNSLPRCALPCFDKGAKSAGCETTDFTCLCGNQQKFISGATSCVLTACQGDELSKTLNTATEICDVVNNDKPPPTAVASASALVTSALGSSASATSSPDSDDSAAFRPEMSFGILGAALAAAFVI
ncbi:hypothetical protein F4808DRAFT_184022 [Astrocystis sublimbata]|nr:hypothetical protein F4808DRAFT_184022 [Astrocystis sublimbata]